MTTFAPPAPDAPRATPRGTPCAASWDDAWVAQVEAREQAMDRRVCGARTIGGKPCPLPSDHASGRCRHHGGFPLTGAPEDNRNAVVHGLYSRRLMICGTHCPAWQSCPMGGGAIDQGRGVMQLPVADRPQCPFEQAEYTATVTDVMKRTQSVAGNSFGLHIAHQVALLTVMVSRAARALAMKPFTEKMEQTAENYYMSVEKPSAGLVAFEKLSRELRRWIHLVEREYQRFTPDPAAQREHELRQCCDTRHDPDNAAALDLTSSIARMESARDTAKRNASLDEIDKRIVDSLFARFGIKPQGPSTFSLEKEKVEPKETDVGGQDRGGRVSSRAEDRRDETAREDARPPT
jgi:hypothetical protein